MKRKFFIVTLATMLFSQNALAANYDFSEIVPSGQRLFFKYSTNGKVIVTSQVSYGYMNVELRPTGNLVIPGSIVHDGVNLEIEYIGKNAFNSCEQLTSVVISDSITSIGEYAFYECYGLTSVVIGNGVTSIGYNAFNDCVNLTSTIYNGTIAQWCNISFVGNGSNPISYSHYFTIGGTIITNNLVIPNSVTEIKPYAFDGGDHLTNISFGSGLQTIGDYAFRGCTQVVRIKSYSTEAPTVQSNTFSDLSDNVVVNVPCGSASVYENAAYWLRFDIQEDLMYTFSVTSGNPSQGTVQIIKQPTCDDAEAVVRAHAYHNYHFVRWSDGNTDSLRYIVVTQDTAIQAEFAEGSGTEGIDNIKDDDILIYSIDGRIHVVAGNHPQDEFRVFDVMGREIFYTTQGDETPQFPAGVYLVKLKGLPARKVVVIR